MGPRFARVMSVVIGAALAAGIVLALAAPVVACSCMGPQPMATYAGDPEHEIFTGVVGIPDARGVPVQVTRWFQGPATPAIVWLDGSGFGGDGASCGTPLPPAGTEWIFVAFRSEGRALGVNLCTPHAAASAAQGEAMFLDAVATFGDVRVMGPEPDPPEAGAPDDLPLPLPVLVALGTSVVLMVGVALLLAHGRRDRTRQS